MSEQRFRFCSSVLSVAHTLGVAKVDVPEAELMKNFGRGDRDLVLLCVLFVLHVVWKIRFC